MTDGRDQLGPGGPDHLSRAEIAKDVIQAGAEATAHTVGEVATILSRAVGDVAAAVGGLATEMFEIRDASRRAMAEHVDDDPAIGDAGPVVDLDEPTPELDDPADPA